MRFSWDPAKSDANFRTRGLVEDVELTVCFTDREHLGSVVERRIISARRSNRRERQAYWQAIKGR